MMMRRDDESSGLLATLGRLGLFFVAATLAGLVSAAIALPFIGGAGAGARNLAQAFENLPDDIKTPPLPQRTLILAADGSPLATLYYQNRVEVPLTAVSPAMRQAIVAIEDARFLDHHGFDIRGAVRALARNTSAGGVQQGASTLTMQYVKNVLVNQATTADELQAARGQSTVRKLREVRFALALERRFDKAEILERYLNIVYFGAGAYGVEAAARRYFSKTAAELTLPEAATLAGIVQQPVAFDPLRNPELSQKRRDVVLNRMVAAGFISQQEADDAARTPMAFLVKPTASTNGCTTSAAPFFCDYVLQTIRSDPAFGDTPEAREAFLRRGGYVIRTTLDPKAQAGALEATTTAIPIDDPSRKAAAISMVQPGTGNVIAMAQNRLWGTSGVGYTTYNYNVDRQSGGTIGMQAGSTFKVFTLAAALEAGISPFEPISSPSPATFTKFKECETGVPFPPVTVRNSTGQGTFAMPQGTAYSINTYFMAIEERTGLCRPAEIAEEMGVFRGNGEPLLRVPSFTLGSMEVTPLQMAAAYAAFAAHGQYCKPRVVLDIYDRDRNAVPVPPVECTQVVTEEVADSVTALLTYVVDGPIDGRTGARMSLADRPAAGKTGTTNDSAAVWFCGFTPDLAAAVWVGDPRGGFRYPMKNLEINGKYYAQVFGGTLPGPIWNQAMTTALADSPPEQFSLASKWGLRPGRGLTSVPGANRQETSVAEEEFVFENANPDDAEEIDPTAPIEGEVPEGDIAPDAPALPEEAPSP